MKLSRFEFDAIDLKPLSRFEHYLRSLVEGKLWLKVLIAMAIGIGAGIALGPETEWVSRETAESVGNWLSLPGKLFLKLVQMIMIPLIVASIITGIVSNSSDQLKQMGFRVGVYFILTTTVAITLGTILSYVIQPGKYVGNFAGSTPAGGAELPLDSAPVSGLSDIPGAISNILPENPLAAMVTGEMLSVVIFTVIIGIAVTQLRRDLLAPVVKLFEAIQEVCMVIVKWAMKIVPIAVFGLMADLVSGIGLGSVKGIGLFVLTVLAGLICLLILYMVIISVVAKKNPFHFLRAIREVQLLAFSTASSAAVMPLSMKTAVEKLNIRPSISNFLIPVGATINMDGTAIFQSIATIFIAQAYGVEMDLAATILVMVTIVSASIGTPAIPGGGVIILASVLGGAGIPVDGVMLIIGVDRILGMFRTAVNVTGDLTACAVFDQWMPEAEPGDVAPIDQSDEAVESK